jgi:hypothetical protein
MDRPGPLEDPGAVQAIELHVAVVAFVDRDTGDRLAIPVRRQRVELAGTTVRTTAVDELARFDFPGCHGVLRNRWLEN